MLKGSWVLLIAVVLLGISALYAQTEAPGSDEVVKETQALEQTASNAGSDKVFETLSKQLTVPVSDLRAQQQNTNFGFGQLFMANALANATAQSAAPMTFQEIADEFNSGKGWGQIAKENGVKLGSIVSGIKRSNRAIQAQLRNQNRAAAAENASRGSTERPNRPAQSGRPMGRGNGHGRPR